MGVTARLLVVLPLLGALLSLRTAAAREQSTPAPQSPASPATRRLVYAGDEMFPPYEYLGADGRPRGFNVELVRLLAKESGVQVDVRLSRWKDVMDRFDAGQVDLVSLAYAEHRIQRYDYLFQTWTLHRGFLFRPGRSEYPRRLEDLAGETVAVEERGQLHEFLEALPPERRPALRLARNHLEVCRMLGRGEATMAVGNHFTLRHLAAQIGLGDVVSVEIQPFAYALVTVKGRGEELAYLRDAFERIRHTNEYNALVERSLVLPAPPRTWRDFARYLAPLLGVIVALAAASLLWNRSLRGQVAARTRQLAGSLEEKERLIAEASSLRQERERFFDLSPTLFVVLDSDGTVGHVNPAWQRVLGHRSAALIGSRVQDLIHPDDMETARAEAKRLGTGISGLEVRLRHADGSYRWLLWNAVSVPEQKAIYGVALDITDRKRAQQEIHHLAYHDSLTGLPNRELFLDRLDVAVAHAQRHRSGLAVLFIDLDSFKVINDSLGHSIGDKLLQAVATRIRHSLREEDSVARMGGDEFTALVAGMTETNDVSKVARKLQSAIKQPVVVDGHELSISASIGIGLYPGDGETAALILKNADTAMYRAKELGRDNHQFYTASMSARVVEHLNLEGRLRKALANDDLLLHYQPVMRLDSGRIEGVEALLRWRDQERGIVPPAEFITLAEVTGLIVEIGPWVLRTACREIGEHPVLRVAVNLSARQFHHGEVVGQVRRVLEETGFEPGRLELEITETLAMQDQEKTVQTLKRLKELGVSLSIDDFGTGYSSLSYLRRFPLDTLKIDRSFVSDIDSDPGAADIATTIIAMGKRLGLRVVAEGVETEEQLAFLREQGCDEVQGFLLSRGVPADELRGRIAETARVWSQARSS